jgi:cytochrome P450
MNAPDYDRERLPSNEDRAVRRVSARWGETMRPYAAPVLAASQDGSSAPPEQIMAAQDYLRELIDHKRAADHLTFTYGPHYCLGAHLANTALRSVLARFPKLQVAVPDDQLVWKNGLAVRELPVSW